MLFTFLEGIERWRRNVMELSEQGTRIGLVELHTLKLYAMCTLKLYHVQWENFRLKKIIF